MLNNFLLKDIFDIKSKIYEKNTISLYLFFTTIFSIVFISVIFYSFFKENNLYWSFIKNLISIPFLLFLFHKIGVPVNCVLIYIYEFFSKFKMYFLKSFKYILFVVILLLIFLIVFSFVTGLIYSQEQIKYFFSDNSSFEKNIIRFKFENHKLEFFMYMLSVSIFTPIVEEILFRRFLYVRLRKNNGIIKSIFLSSLVFSLLHFPESIGSFLGSCFLCYVYEKENNIYVPIIIHSIKNFIAILYIIS